jgi:hypothetical protein
MIDERKTLDELENTEWGEPTYNSYLVRTCHALRKKLLVQFTAGDLRLMIGQNISLQFLIPKALEVLAANPFVEGDYYPGDLLAVVMRSDAEFWTSESALCQRALKIAQAAFPQINGMENSTDEIRMELAHVVGDFLQLYGEYG